MSIFSLPWLELAVLLPLLGAVPVALIRDRGTASRWSLALTGGAFVFAFLEWLGFRLDLGRDGGRMLSGLLSIDELSAPLVPAVALLHLFTVLMTARIHERKFSFAGLLVGDAIGLATFGCLEPSVLVGLLALGTVPPFVELYNRRCSTRVYSIHMASFVVLLGVGWGLVESGVDGGTGWASVPLLLAVLIRCGAVPVHCWITDLFENASFGTSLLVSTTMTGVYAAVRLVLPVAPDWVLQGIGAIAILTAVYAAGMAVVQTEARRFFAYLFLSQGSMVLIGLELHTPLSLTGALCLWFSVMLSLGGFGLVLRAVESRFGRLSLTRYHGLYDQSPPLAVAFLLTGLASVGFPGTLGFVSSEILIDGAIHADLLLGIAITTAAALNGIAVIRAYFLIFTGTRHGGSLPMGMTIRERVAVLSLLTIILGGGLLPQPGVTTRYRAAEEIIESRKLAGFDPVEPVADGPATGEEPPR